MQKHVNLVDLVKSFPTNIFLQNLASIQKRTSPIKFAHLAENQRKVRYRTFQLRFLHGCVTSENVSLLMDSIDYPYAKLTGLGTSRRFDETLASHPGVDVYAVCALLVRMLAKNKRELPLWLPTFHPVVEMSMRSEVELRPSAADLVGLLQIAFDADESDPDFVAVARESVRHI